MHKAMPVYLRCGLDQLPAPIQQAVAQLAISKSSLAFPAKAGTHSSTTRNFLKRSQWLASGMGSCRGNDRPRLSLGKRINSHAVSGGTRLRSELEDGERPPRLDAANRDLEGSGRLHRYQSRRNLYRSFITQNVNASRILIVETAFDPCNRVRTHAIRRQRAGIGYRGLGERASI